VVQAWLVDGLSHNYPGGTFQGGFSDPYAGDLTPAIYDFSIANYVGLIPTTMESGPANGWT
jgi:hypothetical protein